MLQQIIAARASSEFKIKFGNEVSRNYKDTMKLDNLNNNTFWADAMKTELD